MNNAYHALESHFATLDAIEGAASILHWDTEVMMPSGSMDIRSEQMAALAAIAHEKMTHPAVADWLAKAESDTAALDTWQKANLREMARLYHHATALPADLVTALSKATSQCEHVWRSARKANDYAGFKPYFEEVLRRVRDAADAKAAALGLSPYDALLNGYDPDLTADMIDGYFAPLHRFLPDFVGQVIEHQASRPAPLPLDMPVPLAQQEALGRRLMSALGFGFNHGRIDVSAHPFCGGVPGDIRLTTRYDEHHFVESLYAVLHETGHALYEMGLPAQWRQQPVGKARGMSLHESQSLFIEMQLCLGEDFLHFLLPLLQETFGVSGAAWSMENVTRHITRVNRSLIRVTADECTYPLHVMLRYKLEKALLSGDLSADDLPAAWDDEMQVALGIRPDCVGNGCLQDTHWPGGAIGYFPTYSIGAMMAAQWMDALRHDLPDCGAAIRAGNFTPLREWLASRIHAKASSLSTPELLIEVTGKPLDVAIYQRHLTTRYMGQ